MVGRGAAGAARLANRAIMDNVETGDAWEGFNYTSRTHSPGRGFSFVHNPLAPPSMAELKAKPDESVRFLKECGVARVGELRTTDPEVFSKFRGKAFLTIGSDSADVDCALLWAQRLGLAALESRGRQQSMPMEVNYTSAAFPDLEQHLLMRQGPRNAPAGVRRAQRLWGLLRHLVVGRLLRPALQAATWAHDVQLEAFVVAVKDAAAPGEAGLIQPLLKRFQAQACSIVVFGLPAVQAVVSYKWDMFARRLLLINLVIYLVWLLAFLGFMYCFEAGDGALTLPELLSSYQGRCSVFFEVLALCGMAPFLLGEVFSAGVYRWGWLSSWNVLDLGTYALQATITCLHMGHFTVGTGGSLSRALPLLLGIQCILLFIRLQFFSRCFRGTAFDFLDSLRSVLQDTWWYICVMLLLVVGFAGAFWVTFRDTEQAEFSSLSLASLTMLNWAVGGASYYLQDLLKSAHPEVATALCIVYQFVVSMIMMSLLIGVLTAALAKSTSQEQLKFHLSRAQTIDELETIIPRFLLRRIRFPRYIHVLRINPQSIEKIESRYLWLPPGHANSEPAGGGNGGGAGGRGGNSRDMQHNSNEGQQDLGTSAAVAAQERDITSTSLAPYNQACTNGALAERPLVPVAVLEGRLQSMEAKMDALQQSVTDLKQLLLGQQAKLG